MGKTYNNYNVFKGENMRNIKLEEGNFYSCGRFVKDSEYGMQYMNDISCYDGNGYTNFPIFAICVNGELIEIVTGMKLQFVDIHDSSEYYRFYKKYENLITLKKDYFYINGIHKVTKDDVALTLHKLEKKHLEHIYEDELIKEYNEQQKVLSTSLNIAKDELIDNEKDIYDSDKIIRKFLSKHKL